MEYFTPLRIIIGISGASGAIYGVRLLQALQALEVETHLVITPQAEIALEEETSWTLTAVKALATVVYAPDDLAATIASGSFSTNGMVVAPCSIKTLSAIAYSYTDNLLTRAADVMLKEGRPLILMVRETPLHLGHLRLMVRAAECGAILMPPIPTFYARPSTIEDLIDQTIGRVLARLGVQNNLCRVWKGNKNQTFS
ncbi:MAG: UbiX family flavin prenyltransferase [Anaerolineae bacterium]|nr:UbiX family flavin prenyltransferase [Anaerolineae bacterium]